jgi:hypothetical protein
MNRIFIILAGLVFIYSLTGCGKTGSGGNKSESVKSVSTDSIGNSAVSANKNVGEWVKRGVECYGIVIMNMSDGKTIGKSVKCKVMSVKPEKVKMKTIEKVSLMESKGCDKLGLAYGDTWWETEGDIFKTREEADKYLLEKGWFIQ